MPETMAPPGTDPEESVATLRGPDVEVDVRRAARVAVGLVLVALAVLAGVLFVAGYQKNSQIDRLRAQGVPVELTVTGCLGLMGGSGSNQAGFDCRGTYTVAGHQYTEDIPGNTLHAPGTTVRGLIVPGDPALFSTPATVEAEHAAWTVYLVPAILLGVLLALIVLIVARARRAPSGSGPDRAR